ncbi:hypothetical protein HPP92_010577 [Vanilla planifolia]|uniref:Homeobox domain-containing protein n=1 Tax=Vanilla planifolia TaxID=51239 RepID=A0A835R9W7_VANPL|nr:hypothetical protein HPP92_010577 [Vanilla planifolia]
MKVQQLRIALLDQNSSVSNSSSTSSSSLNLNNLKRLRPLAPHRFPTASSIEPSGTTRWNPAKEQIRMLESLYQSGMRTPNAQQIENITCELVRYGRIEGKNVFYWFQNHKARERQKHRRNALLGLPIVAEDGDALPSPDTNPFPITNESPQGGEAVEKTSDDGRCKRRCKNWEGEMGFAETNGNDGRIRTLELFPLHPENIHYKTRT